MAIPIRAQLPARTPGADRGLSAHAAIMLLLGLLSGFSPFFAKAKIAGLEAHNIGVIQGTLLFALAAVWPSLGHGAIVTAARVLRADRPYANLAGGTALGPLECERDVYSQRRLDARRRRPLDGDNGCRSLESYLSWSSSYCVLILWAVAKKREN